ncbi:hypothetical protein MASR2M47_20430 [Draconibacterium sp.]|jgi:uncharacterized cupin superfamily protein
MKIEVDQLDLDELKELGVKSWPIMEYDEEKFELYYDKTEQCYIISGEATIVSEFETITVKPGDFVTLPAGIECVWDVDSAIRKHYIVE